MIRPVPTITALVLADFSPVPARVAWAWLDAGHRIAAIWTSGATSRRSMLRDRSLGRLRSKWSLSAAINCYDVHCRQIDRMTDPSVMDDLAALDIDVVISVHFPLILPKAVLARLRVPAINSHPALLPAYRGPSPLITMLRDQAADTYGGVTLHGIVPAIDAGPIFGQVRVPLPADRNPRRWELDLGHAAAKLVLATVPGVVAGTNPGVAQDPALATYRRQAAEDYGLTTAMSGARIDWLTATIGPLQPLTMTIAGRDYRIAGVVKHLGPSKGRAARIGWQTIDVDLDDGRYRLRRRPLWEGRKLRWSTFLMRFMDRA